MPTYEYLCASCRCRFEKFQGINDDVLETCPECGGTVKRVISGGSGFLMKGGGSFAEAICQGGACGMDSANCGNQFGCGGPEGCGCT